MFVDPDRVLPALAIMRRQYEVERSRHVQWEFKNPLWRLIGRQAREWCAWPANRIAVFGMLSHRFEMHPPLRADDVARAEAYFGARFPGEYREFLLTVGNGPAGPEHGLFPLDETAHGWTWDGDGGGMESAVAAPFPYTDAWNLDFSEYLEPGMSEDDELARMRFEEAYFDEVHTHGAIPICHAGCAIRRWLIVTGPCRGEVWDDDRAGDCGLSPLLRPDGSRHTFGTWYMEWFEAAVAAMQGAAG